VEKEPISKLCDAGDDDRPSVPDAVLWPDPTETDEMIKIMDRILLQGGWLKEGDSVVFVAGQPIGRSGSTNLVKLHRIGELW
jgi:pyruvate kinase